MGKNASANVKRRVKNKFIRALRRVESQELSKERFFKDRQKTREAELEKKVDKQS